MTTATNLLVLLFVMEQWRNLVTELNKISVGDPIKWVGDLIMSDTDLTDSWSVIV